MAASTSEVFLQLTVILLVAVVAHFVIKRFRQPTIIGEIGIGVILGPSVVGAFGVVLFDPGLIESFAALGAIFLLFLIGLESDFRAMYTKKNFFVALGGVLLPLAFGFLTAYFMVGVDAIGSPDPNQFAMAMFVGATLVATSTAIAASVLLDMGLMRDDVAQTIMGAAVVDDILGLVILSMVVGMAKGGVDAVSLAVITGTAVAFIVVAILVGIYFFSRIVVRVQVAGMPLGLKHGGFIIAMAVTFLYAFVSEAIGLSAIIGAFIAGTMFSSTPLREDFTDGAGYLGAVFTPIFFISLGLLVDLRASMAQPSLFLFAGVLSVVAVVTKVVGCAIPARLAKMSRHESLSVGWGMTPRGEVGLIVALAALSAGVIGDGLFSIIVLVMIVVSVVPAPFFKRSLQVVAKEREEAKREEAPEPA